MGCSANQIDGGGCQGLIHEEKMVRRVRGRVVGSFKEGSPKGDGKSPNTAPVGLFVSFF